jgi:hypothetical protein
MLSSGLHCSMDHILSYDPAVGACYRVFFQLAWNDLFKLVFQPQSKSSHFLCRVISWNFVSFVSGKQSMALHVLAQPGGLRGEHVPPTHFEVNRG